MLSRRTLLAAAFSPGLPPARSIVLKLPSAEIGNADWPGNIDAPVQPGSLWKPFLAAAHSSGPSPRFHCDGSQCWLGRRHGTLDLPGALAQSCNQWFFQFAKTLTQPLPTLLTFGLPAQSTPDWTRWFCPPLQLARAYAELFARQADYPLVIAGLRRAAEQGTARPLGRHYLAKTGTGPSQHHAGDGWVLAAHPADLPSKLILYHQPGVTGAQAALALAHRLKKEPL